MEDVIKWAEEHGYPDLDYVNSITILRNELPFIRVSRARDDETYGDEPFKMCLVVATNRTDKDRQRALNKELIESYRVVHGWSNPPRWLDYVPAPS